MLSFCAGSSAQSIDETSTRLQELREEIRGVEDSISSARDESDDLLKELKDIELDATVARQRLAGIDERIARHGAQLDELRREQERQEMVLDSERRQLASHVRAAYGAGRNDFIKLLLNQEDPALMGRMLAYHEYYSRARAARIARINASITELVRIGNSVEEETQELQLARAAQVDALRQLDGLRESRTAVMRRLAGYIGEQDRQLHLLLRTESELASLLETLERRESCPPRAIETWEVSPLERVELPPESVTRDLEERIRALGYID